jgi:hypothetical protein
LYLALVGACRAFWPPRASYSPSARLKPHNHEKWLEIKNTHYEKRPDAARTAAGANHRDHVAGVITCPDAVLIGPVLIPGCDQRDIEFRGLPRKSQQNHPMHRPCTQYCLSFGSGRTSVGEARLTRMPHLCRLELLGRHGSPRAETARPRTIHMQEILVKRINSGLGKTRRVSPPLQVVITTSGTLDCPRTLSRGTLVVKPDCVLRNRLLVRLLL